MTYRWVPAWLGAGLLAAAMVGCGEDETAPTTDAGDAGGEGTKADTAGVGDKPERVCVPGETQHCLGPGACEGAQTCLEQGTGWGICDCGSSSGGAGGQTAVGAGGFEVIVAAGGRPSIDAAAGSSPGGVGGSIAGASGAAGAAVIDPGDPRLDPRYGLLPWRPDPASLACLNPDIPEPLGPVLMFVVDVSGSMTQAAPGTDMTKWDATRQVLSGLVADPALTAAMGIVHYPNMDPAPLPRTEPTQDVSECVNTAALVDPQPMSDAHRATLQNVLMNAVVVQGGTPTHSAYTVGLEALVASEAQLGPNLFMVLITDGEPTYGVGCVGNGTILPSNMDAAYIADTQAAIRAALALSTPVRTFVIGSPGSELNYLGEDARPWLSIAAEVGGTAPDGCSSTGLPEFCHLDLTDPNANFSQRFSSALADVVARATTCDYDPSSNSDSEFDAELVSVLFFNGAEEQFFVPRASAESCSGAHGWYLTAEGLIRLCPATCALVQADASSGTGLVYGCKNVL